MALGFGDAESSKGVHWAGAQRLLEKVEGIVARAKLAADVQDSSAVAWRDLPSLKNLIEEILEERKQVIAHEVRERTRRRWGTKVEW